jgi:hypothetical protein
VSRGYEVSRLDEIQERLHHEPCCDHRGADEHGCWDCRNTGCAHPPYTDGQAAADLAALLAFARSVRDELATPNPETAVIAQALDALEATP